MGDFRIEVNATGGHGCQREKGNKSKIERCGDSNCPDCLARTFVEMLKTRGVLVKDALLIHWPNSSPIIVDNLNDGTRYGDF